jgi:hypothetical protein
MAAAKGLTSLADLGVRELPGLPMFLGDARRNVAQHRVATYPDHALAAVLGHRRYVVAQIASEDAAEQFDVVALGDEHINVAKDRVCVDVDLCWSALGLGQIDGHVAQERDRDQFILDVPGPRTLALQSAFKDRGEGEKPSAALTRGGPRLVFRVASHGVTRSSRRATYLLDWVSLRLGTTAVVPPRSWLRCMVTATSALT